VGLPVFVRLKRLTESLLDAVRFFSRYLGVVTLELWGVWWGWGFLFPVSGCTLKTSNIEISEWGGGCIDYLSASPIKEI
jgi:hypothetical protein